MNGVRAPSSTRSGTDGAARQVHRQSRAHRHGDRGMVRLQENRGHARVGGRRDPGLDLHLARLRRPRQSRLERRHQPARSVTPGDHQRGDQARAAPRAEGPPVQRGEARMRPAQPQPPHSCQAARDMCSPQREAGRVVGGRPVGQRRERPVLQAGVTLQPPVGGGGVRRGEPGQAAPQQHRDRHPGARQQPGMRPPRQHRQQIQQRGTQKHARRPARRATARAANARTTARARASRRRQPRPGGGLMGGSFMGRSRRGGCRHHHGLGFFHDASHPAWAARRAIRGATGGRLTVTDGGSGRSCRDDLAGPERLIASGGGG